MTDRPLRLGDVIDDYCPRCRLLLNHDVASIDQGAAAKVTCRTCHNTHDFRNAQVPTKRKTKQDQERQNLIEQNAPTPTIFDNRVQVIQGRGTCMLSSRGIGRG